MENRKEKGRGVKQAGGRGQRFVKYIEPSRKLAFLMESGLACQRKLLNGGLKIPAISLWSLEPCPCLRRTFIDVEINFEETNPNSSERQTITRPPFPPFERRRTGAGYCIRGLQSRQRWTTSAMALVSAPLLQIPRLRS